MNDKVKKLTYSISEAAEALGIGKQRMYELTFVEGFPVLRLGKIKRIPVDQLHEWVEAKAKAQEDILQR